jgi:hypothetical protein
MEEDVVIEEVLVYSSRSAGTRRAAPTTTRRRTSRSTSPAVHRLGRRDAASAPDRRRPQVVTYRRDRPGKYITVVISG